MLDDLDDTPVPLRPTSATPAWVYSAVKAAVDLLAGLVGSLLAVLIAPLIWLVYRFEDGGPLFYRQERTGLGGRPRHAVPHHAGGRRVQRAGVGVGQRPAGDSPGAAAPLHPSDELPQFFNAAARR